MREWADKIWGGGEKIMVPNQWDWDRRDGDGGEDWDAISPSGVSKSLGPGGGARM